MTCGSLYPLFFAILIVANASPAQPATMPSNTAPTIPSTIFNDPNYEGAADPEIVWNDKAQEWWIFYTARRMMAEVNPGCGGTPVGVCSSKDLIHWEFRGYCKLDGAGGTKDLDYTCWAPGVIADETGNYHMFLTYKPSADGFWGGDISFIRHYVTSGDDLLNGWKKVSDITPPPHSIDAGLLRADGKWWMWYRDFPKKGAAPGSLWWATSADGTTWDLHGQVPGDVNNQKVNGASYQEAPYAFRWKDKHWLIADAGPNLNQYVSDDLKDWKYTGPLMQNPGSDPEDRNSGKHASVAVIGDRAFIVYFNHPYKPADKSVLEKKKADRSWLHIRELELKDGKLTCDRDKMVTPPASVKPDTINAGR